MTEKQKYLLSLLGACVAPVMLMGIWIALTLWGGMLYFITIFAFLAIPAVVGHIMVAIGLVRAKLWAWGMFLTTLVLAICAEILLALTVGGKGNELEFLAYLYFHVSLILFPIFGIVALIRKLSKKQKI